MNCTINDLKIGKIDKYLFAEIEEKIKNLQQDSDKDDFETIKEKLKNPPILSPEDFAFEAIYVILAGGFSQKTAKKKFNEIRCYIENNNNVSADKLFEIFHNKNKINAIVKIWNERKTFRQIFYSLKSGDEKLNFLETLPHIGKITKNHLARNLGVSVVKYDIWIQRLGIALFGNIETAKFPLDENVKKYCDKMFDNLQKETGSPIGYLDAVLWKACQIGIFSFR
ncbi:MAG: hypothetical protein LBH98_05730 [Chitinispirillales bacterium]|jgi:hypothetical protein|nr:hypothetical protein [Chitinispirillales bacterium]